jgi:hypothetical protein
MDCGMRLTRAVRGIYKSKMQKAEGSKLSAFCLISVCNEPKNSTEYCMGNCKYRKTLPLFNPFTKLHQTAVNNRLVV